MNSFPQVCLVTPSFNLVAACREKIGLFWNAYVLMSAIR